MELDDSITGDRIKHIGLRGGDPSGQPENTGPSHNGHFTVRARCWVPAQKTKSATIELPPCENIVQGHEQIKFLHPG